jgi:RNA polymerase sigma factor (sigma-70 family)
MCDEHAFESQDQEHYLGERFRGAVYVSMRPGLLGFVMKTLHMRDRAATMDDALDITQTTFANVYERLDVRRLLGCATGEDRRRLFRGYLYTTAFGLVLRHTQMARRTRALFVSGADNLDELWVDEQVEREIGPVRRSVSRDDLREFVRRLPARERTILVWRYCHNLSWSTIAAKLNDGTSANALRVQNHRLRKTLHELAAASGFVLVFKEKRS